MKRTASLFIVLCLTARLLAFSAGAQSAYSATANSGIRGQVCTTLADTGCGGYYTGEYTIEALSGLCSGSLLNALRELMTATHTTQTRYSDCRDLAVLTDCENADGTTVNLLYSGCSVTWNEWCTNTPGGWNREHVWPQSTGGFKTSGPGSDLHHVRPSDQLLNARRGNLPYGNVTDGSLVFGSDIIGSIAGGWTDGVYFEPVDSAKGDVARIILYLYVRYGGDARYTLDDVTGVFESVEVLLQWCALDPVDTWEMGRNEVVSAIQGNRNVFIDYPELAWLIFGEEIPANLVTPSGGAVTSAATQTHTATVTVNASATYTGDVCCAYCGCVLETGSFTAAPTAPTETESVETAPPETVPEETSPVTEISPSAPTTGPSESLATEAPLPSVPSDTAEQERESFPWAIVSVLLLCGTAVLIVISRARR